MVRTARKTLPRASAPAGLSLIASLLVAASPAHAGSLRPPSWFSWNQPPVILGAPVTSGAVGVAYAFQPTASDPEGKTVTFACQGLPAWAKFDSRTGRLSGTPTAAGTYSRIKISASDGRRSSSLPEFAITVSGPTVTNAAPAITGTPPTQVVAGQNYSFVPRATDSNGDALTFAISGKPSWATFNAATGALTGVPGTSHVGSHPGIVIQVTDGRAATALPAFTITVAAPPNTAPTIAGAAPTTATAGQPYAFRPSASDADGDALAFGIANRPAWASFDVDSGTLYGTPGDADVGTQANIVVSVSDGRASATLAPFAITVSRGATTTVTLQWSAPQTNTDGTPLTDLAGYKVHYGTASRSYAFSLQVDGAGNSSAVIEGLSPGTYYFAIQSVNTAGVASDYSGEVSATI